MHVDCTLYDSTTAISSISSQVQDNGHNRLPFDWRCSINSPCIFGEFENIYAIHLILHLFIHRFGHMILKTKLKFMDSFKLLFNKFTKMSRLI